MLELIFQGFLEWAYGLVLECWEYFSTVLLDIMSMDFAYLKSHVPVMDDIMQVLMAVGWALLIGNLVFQALKSMASGLGFEGEDPKLLFTRTFVFSFLLLASPQICGIGLSLTAKIIDLLQIPTAVHVTLVDESVFGHLAASWLLVILFGVIVMFKVFRLLLEIAERYVILAMLTMTAPLAFAMGGSKSTSDIFSGWCRMFGSMCVLMTTHVIFFKMLLSVLATVPSGLDMLPWIVLLLTIVKVARKADAIITRIGLNPAITGDSLGRMMPGALTYMIVRSATSRITRTIGRTTGNGGGFYGASPRGRGPRTGGPPGGQSTAGSFYQCAGQSARHTSGQQGFSAQSRDAQTGSVHSAAQEHSAYTVAQNGSAVQQTSFHKASERKNSAMPEARRVPERMQHGSYTSSSGIRDTVGKAAPQTESGRDVVREAPKAGGDVRHSMQPNMSRADGPGHAGTPEAPESTLMSQGKTRELQGRAAAGTVGKPEQSKKDTVQGTDTAAPRMLHGKPYGDAKNTPVSITNGQESQQSPSGETRFSQRLVRQPVSATALKERTSAQQTSIHTLTEQPSPAGTAPIRFGQAPDTEPRPGRNTLRAGTAPSAQARQHEPVRQERRPAGGSSAPVRRGTASIPRPGPAGNTGNRHASETTRPTAKTPAPTPRTDLASRPVTPPSAKSGKGVPKREQSTVLSRKKRGNTHE
mgnify:CR=1 FL=1